MDNLAHNSNVQHHKSKMFLPVNQDDTALWPLGLLPNNVVA